MKQFRSTFILLIIAILFGGYVYFRERGKVADTGNTVLLRIDKNAVSQITIHQSKKPITLTKKQSTWWVAAEKKHVPADPDSVKSLLDNLELVQSGSVVAKPGKLKEYGLGDAAGSVAVNDAVIKFGDAADFDSSKVYALIKNGSGKTVALLPTSFRDSALKTFANWRDKAVLRFDEEDVSKLSIVAPNLEATFVSSKTGEDVVWKITSPVQAKAVSSTVQTFLTTLSAAQTPSFLNANPQDLAKWSLDKPIAIVQVSTDQGTQKLIIGKSASGGRAAQNQVTDTVFVLPSSVYSLINRQLGEWRDKDVLSLDTSAVTQMQISARGKNVSLNLAGSNWTATNPKLDATVVNNAAIDFLVGLQNLKANAFVNSPSDDAQFGFNKFALKVRMTSTKWQSPKVIIMGIHDGKNYAKIIGSGDASQTVYVLPEDVFDAFSNALDHLFGK